MKSEGKKNQYKVGYMLNLGLKINKALREQVKINLDWTFGSKSMMHIKRV